MQMKFFMITNVDSGVIGQRLFRYSISVRYWRKIGNTIGTVNQLFMDFKKAYFSLRGKYYTIISLSMEYPGN
jgi:hypothetical protein